MSNVLFFVLVSFFSVQFTCASPEGDPFESRKHAREEPYAQEHEGGEKRQRHLDGREISLVPAQAERHISTFQEACDCLHEDLVPSLSIFKDIYKQDPLKVFKTLQERCVNVLLRFSENHATLGNLEPIKFLRRQAHAYPGLADVLFERDYFEPNDPTLHDFLLNFSKLYLLTPIKQRSVLAWSNFSFLRNSPYLHSFKCANEPGGLGAVSLKFLTNLSHLEICDGNLWDLSFLSRMHNLASLDIELIGGQTPLLNSDQLPGLTSLQTLRIQNTFKGWKSLLKALAGVAPLRNLEISDEDGLRLRSVPEFMEGFTSLVNLNLSNCKIKDLSHLAPCKSLETLTLNENKIRCVEALGKFTNLQALFLQDNLVGNMKPLWGLTTLHTLDLTKGLITPGSLSSLAGITSLTHLDISWCTEDPYDLQQPRHVTNLQPLAALPNLTTLIARGIMICPTSLEGVTSLTDLHVGHKCLTNFEPFLKMANLSRLRVSSSAIMIPMVQTLTRLTGLTSLGLTWNKAPWIDGDLSHFVPLTQLRYLDLCASGTEDRSTPHIRVISRHEDLRTLNTLGHLQQLTLLPYNVAPQLHSSLIAYPFIDILSTFNNRRQIHTAYSCDFTA